MTSPVRQMLAPVRRQLATAVALQALGTASGMVPFIVVAELGALLLAGAPTPAAIWTLVVAGAAAAVLSLVLTMAATTVSHYADNALQLDLRRRMADRLGRVPLGWFSARSSGQVKKALQDDVHAMHYLVAHTLLDVTAVLVAPLTAVLYLGFTDWRLTLLNLVPLAVGVGLFRRAMRGAGAQMTAYGRAQREINSSIVEFVEGIAVVKTFGGGRRAHRRFDQACAAFHDFFSAWSRRTTSVTTASQLSVTPTLVLLLLLSTGAVFITAGWMPAADLVPFALLGPVLVAPIGVIGTRLQALRSGTTAAASVATLLAEPELPRPERGAVPHGSAVVLRGVRFRYSPDAEEVLRGIDLELAPGTVTALVGPSGAGKSTMAALVPRFHDVTAGSVTVGGVDVRELDPATLYRTVGFVFQDVALLRMSVAENIALARPDASAAEIRAAAGAARIHDRIAALPDGYDTVVGRDIRFSGGEEQRIAIARALLADTPVLVLDEATAFADPESEAAICDALSELAVGRTLLVIAHRLHTVVQADQIVVLEDGQIVERGRHPDLLAAGGRYTRMWRAQEVQVDVGAVAAMGAGREMTP